MNEALLKALAPMLSGMNLDKIFSEKAAELAALQQELGSPIYLMTSVTENNQFQLTIYTTIEDVLEPIKSYIITDVNTIVTIFQNLKNSINEFKNIKTSAGITGGNDTDRADEHSDTATGTTDTTDAVE